MGDQTRKRKRNDNLDVSQSNDEQSEWIGVPKFMAEYISKFNPSRRVRQKLNSQEGNLCKEPQAIKISIQKGFFNLPKEVLIECLMDKGDCLKLDNSTGRGDFYYKCIDPSCKYKLKITENSHSFTTTSANLIRSYKTFDLSSNNELEEGFSKVVVYDDHVKEHNEELIKDFKEKKHGNNFYFSSLLLGVSALVKNLIICEKLYLYRPQICKSKIKEVLENNNILGKNPN